MDKKDKELQNLFSQYENEMPNKRVILEAKNLIEKKKRIKVVRPYFRLATAVVCILITAVVVLNNVIPKIQDPSDSAPIINNVSAKDVLGKSISSIDESVVPWLSEIENSGANLKIYDFKYKSDLDKSANVYLIKYNTFSEDGYGYVNAYIELENTNYDKVKDFKNLNSTKTISGVEVIYATKYLNGEYMTYASLTISNTDYYFEVMSNSEMLADEHLAEIFKSF